MLRCSLVPPGGNDPEIVFVVGLCYAGWVAVFADVSLARSRHAQCRPVNTRAVAFPACRVGQGRARALSRFNHRVLQALGKQGCTRPIQHGSVMTVWRCGVQWLRLST